MRTKGLRLGVLLCLTTGLPAVADDGLVGSWAGSYVCNRDSANMLLVLTEQPSMLEGVFTFKNKRFKGSYKIAGKLATDGSFVVVPLDWIEKPNRPFAALRMEGVLDREKAEIKGALPDCIGEGSFTAARGDMLPEDVDPPTNVPGLGGKIAAAETAQQQCNIISDWLKPYSDVTARTTIDVGLKRSVGAFQDEVFEPVFGTTLLFMNSDQRRALRVLHDRICMAMEGMEHINIVISYGLGSETHFTKLVKIISDTTVVADWVGGFKQRLESTADDLVSVDTLRNMRDELRKQQRTLLPEEYEELQEAIDSREQDIKLAVVTKKLVEIPDDGFDELRLNTLFSAIAEAERYNFDRDVMARFLGQAETKARTILRPKLQDAAALAAAIPRSLDGLRQGEDFLRPLERYRALMDQNFGTIDHDGKLRQLDLKLREMRNDPAVVAEFRDLALDAAQGPDGERTVKALATEYFGSHSTFEGSDFQRTYSEALNLAEVKAVKVVNLAADSAEGEPSPEDIASFALQRVREANAEIAAKEERCMAGGFSNSFDALNCLDSPGVFTGQKGFGMRLLEVRKVGCKTEVPNAQYRCIFTQQLQINIPGSDAMRWGSMIAWAEKASRGEPLDALFIRAPGGTWTIVWGDL